jgi:hypothetical protein
MVSFHQSVMGREYMLVPPKNQGAPPSVRRRPAAATKGLVRVMGAATLRSTPGMPVSARDTSVLWHPRAHTPAPDDGAGGAQPGLPHRPHVTAQEAIQGCSSTSHWPQSAWVRQEVSARGGASAHGQSQVHRPQVRSQ